jgi:hypothetical protein
MHNAILVIINKGTRYAYFISYKKKDNNAKVVAYFILRYIISVYSVLDKIISNRDIKF